MKKTILLFGAGKSATCLIEYLGKICGENDWKFFVCDSDLSLAKSKTKDFSHAEAISFNVGDENLRGEFISKSDLVISMLPAALHYWVALDCVRFSKSLLTASYIDEKIKLLGEEIKEKKLIFLGEMGLDPGIDHMSAMKIINQLKSEGAEITSFKSHCGGLIAPESDDNPWHYKITWNPANVVMAGNAGAVFLEDSNEIQIPYSEIFSDENNIVDIPGLLPLAWYANRDSLSYLDTYQLRGLKTFIRTTLRYPSYCRAWNKIIQLDLINTNDQHEIENFIYVADWFNYKKEKFISQKKDAYDENHFFNDEFIEQLNFLGLNEHGMISEKPVNSAAFLQKILENKLKMRPDDKDMIVMLHEIEYSLQGKNKKTSSCLIVKGEDQSHTAMAKTVGLPLGIAAKLILENEIKLTGLHIPVLPEIYVPVLKELEMNGIKFIEKTENLKV